MSNLNFVERTWDTSSETSSEPDEKASSQSSAVNLVPVDTNMKLVDGGQTFILTTDSEPRKAKRRQSGHKREFHNLIFKPQYSTLDRSNPVSAASPFIGFYTLFWLGLTFFTIRTFLVSYRQTGHLFGHQMLSILRKDLFVLAATDATMFGVTFLNVLLQKAIYKRWLSWNNWGWKIQHVAYPPFPLLTRC